jgi:tetratricopeptide (TPR) repeat protein
LAKVAGQEDLTHSGDLVGTLRYMAPERFRGQADGRGDVYALGLTLYELLALRPAYDESDRGRLVRQVAEEDPPRLTRLDPTIPRDLATVVHMAMAREPAERYATAAALASDLRRHLEDRPIVARRPSLLDRVAKWSRRYRAAVVAGVVGLVMALAILAGSIGWIVRDRAARLAMTEREVNRALDEATAFQVRAKWPEALEAAKRAEGFLAVGAGDALRRRVRELRKDLEMVLRLEEIWLPHAVHGRERAHDKKWADASYAEAFREYGIDVEALDPSEAAARIRGRAIRLELALALDTWADRRRLTRAEGDASWKRLLAVARAADPDEWRDRVRVALLHLDTRTLNELAATAEVGALPVQTLILLVGWEGLLDPGRAELLLRRAQREHPDDFRINFELAEHLQLLRTSSPDQNQHEVIRFYTAALSVRPRSVETCVHLADALRMRGELTEAIALYRKAIALEPDYVLAYFSLSKALQARGQAEEARSALRAGIRSKPSHPSTSMIWPGSWPPVPIPGCATVPGRSSSGSERSSWSRGTASTGTPWPRPVTGRGTGTAQSRRWRSRWPCASRPTASTGSSWP